MADSGTCFVAGQIQVSQINISENSNKVRKQYKCEGKLEYVLKKKSEIQSAATRSLANDRQRKRKAVDFAWPTPVANPMETPWRGHRITFIQDYTTTIIVTRSLPMSFSLCQIVLGAHARHQKHTHREQGRRSISHGCAYIHAI